MSLAKQSEIIYKKKFSWLHSRETSTKTKKSV